MMNYYERLILKQQIETRLRKIEMQYSYQNNSILNTQTQAVTSSDKSNDIEYLIDTEFAEIVGLNNIKNELLSFSNYLTVNKERKKRGYNTSSIPLHAVFSGSPGTGKTTVARILGKIYKELNILKKGHVVEVDRGDLVAGYIGQTTIKTKEALNAALDGVLFIDEAYSLSKCKSDEKDFGKEAIEAILKFMEDNRNRISVIVAGYNSNMKHFIDSNPGLSSRFTKFYMFNDFSSDELGQILNINLINEGYEIRDHAFKYIQYFITKFKEISNPETFGNGRSIRNIFEELKLIQGDRIAEIGNIKELKDSFLNFITLQDIKKLHNKFNINLPCDILVSES